MKDKKIISGLIISIISMIIDQAIKLLVIKNFELHEEKKVFGDIFTLYYIRNTGSAWGMLAIFIIGYVYCNIPNKKYTILRVCLALILGGALGNLIDRIRLNYVVDYLYFKLIDFPVFNFADICVTVPVALVVLLCIFKYKGDDFDVIMGEKRLDENGEYIEKRRKND
jgi:signal peptidase II